jgi:hypothetical protein
MARAASTKKTKDDEYEWVWLNTVKTDKDAWILTHIPEGEICAPRIKRSSKNSDGSYTFFVYRNGKYIDCENDLEKAKVIAKKGRMRPEREVQNKIMRTFLNETPRDPVAFAKLRDYQQQIIVDGYPWAVPRKSEVEKVTGKKMTTTKNGNQMTKQERRAQDLPMDSVIKRLKPKNPKRENTDAWTRWELLFQHDGKTVGEFIKSHGNPTTLRNAVKAGYVSAEGVK